MQKVKHQHLEVATKIVVGLLVAPVIQYVATPWYVSPDGTITLWNSFRLTLVFACVSYLYQLPLRKLFNHITVRELDANRTSQK